MSALSSGHSQGVDGGVGLNGGFDENILDGQGGIDTATFVSTPRFLDFPEGVEIILGLNGADGRAASFFAIDTLRSIENVIGSNFDDIIVGNEQANTLNGGRGDDKLVHSLGDDTYVGGIGFDTLDFSLAASAVSRARRGGTTRCNQFRDQYAQARACASPITATQLRLW